MACTGKCGWAINYPTMLGSWEVHELVQNASYAANVVIEWGIPMHQSKILCAKTLRGFRNLMINDSKISHEPQYQVVVVDILQDGIYLFICFARFQVIGLGWKKQF